MAYDSIEFGSKLQQIESRQDQLEQNHQDFERSLMKMTTSIESIDKSMKEISSVLQDFKLIAYRTDKIEQRVVDIEKYLDTIQEDGGCRHLKTVETRVFKLEGYFEKIALSVIAVVFLAVMGLVIIK